MEFVKTADTSPPFCQLIHGAGDIFGKNPESRNPTPTDNLLVALYMRLAVQPRAEVLSTTSLLNEPAGIPSSTIYIQLQFPFLRFCGKGYSESKATN